MSKTAPLVSIVVVCHNYGRFLGEAIDSALAQTHSPCEVVVVDDGSTDDSLQVASGYGDAVRVFTQPNQGLERTCNRGVREARGEYFVILSADDVLEPTYVEELLAGLRRSPDASFAYCQSAMFGAETGVMRCFPYSAYFLALRLNYINASALTARRDFLDLGGYAEELAGNTMEDWDFWLRMLEHGKRGTYVPRSAASLAAPRSPVAATSGTRAAPARDREHPRPPPAADREHGRRARAPRVCRRLLRRRCRPGARAVEVSAPARHTRAQLVAPLPALASIERDPALGGEGRAHALANEDPNPCDQIREPPRLEHS